MAVSNPADKVVQVHFLKEVKAQFLTEFDYTNEARNLRRVWQNLRPMFGEEVGWISRLWPAGIPINSVVLDRDARAY